MPKNKVKLCECGCCLPAPIATQTRKDRGHVKGQPMRFIAGHQRRKVIEEKPPKPQMELIAESLGFRTEKSMLKALYKSLKTYGAIAHKIGMSETWVGQRMRFHKIAPKELSRWEKTIKKILKWNQEKGTNYQTSREWVIGLSKELPTSKIVQVTGLCTAIVAQYVREGRRESGEQSMGELTDYRPSNIIGPWTNTKIAPCSECDHHKEGRSKFEPGCVQCPLRLDYVALIERDNSPGVSEHGQAGVYYGPRGHAKNYYEWGQG